MTISILIFSLLALALNFAYLKIAAKYHLVDTANSRSAHQGKVINSGGLVFAFLFFVFLIYQLIFSFNIDLKFYWIILVFGFIFALVGLVDDLLTIKPKLRLIIQIVLSTLIAYFLVPEDWYLFDIWTLNYPMVLFLTFIYLISFINFFNFMDGINGISGFQSLFLLIPLSLVSSDYALVYFLLGILVIIFLAFNLSGKMFMGDCGSYFLGFFLAVSILFQAFDATLNLFFALNILVLIFWIDPVVAFFIRAKNKEKLLEPHNQHLYQKLTRKFNSQTKVLVLFTLIYLLILLPLAGLCLIVKPAVAHTILWSTTLIFVIVISYLQHKFKGI